MEKSIIPNSNYNSFKPKYKKAKNHPLVAAPRSKSTNLFRIEPIENSLERLRGRLVQQTQLPIIEPPVRNIMTLKKQQVSVQVKHEPKFNYLT